jgi:choice-of-anchor B domain-containing protein
LQPDVPCDGIDMLSHVSHAELGTTFVNDTWGWTDPATGDDYTLLGASEGTVFVRITDAKRPQVLGILPTASTSGGAFWRDIKVYADHAYVTSEHNNHGVQVFDLTQLRDWDGSYTTYQDTNRYTDLGRAHNIAVNEDTGFAYAVGANNAQDIHKCAGGLHMIDLDDPTNPVFAGCFAQHGYVHDTQCVVYAGPDTRYHGREICFNSNASGSTHRVDVVDVTDKSNPVSLARVGYDNFGYSHQGWLTPDQRYFLHGDELDELGRGIGTTTRVRDMTDLENPQLIQVFENYTTSIDHNLYTQGRYTYASNYTSGLRVYDSRDLAGSGLSEVAYFDVYPENDNASFEGGTWSNYPYFRQKGVVAVSSIDRGLFILQPRVSRQGN